MVFQCGRERFDVWIEANTSDVFDFASDHGRVGGKEICCHDGEVPDVSRARSSEAFVEL